MALRALTLLASLVLHGTLVLVFLLPAGETALESGAGDDLLVIEHGIAIEGFAKSGEAEETLEPVEAPREVSQARPPLEEVKPVEEEQAVIASNDGPHHDEIVREPKPELLEPPHPAQIATLDQPEAAVEQQRASGARQAGGDTTSLSAYRGKLYAHLERKKVNPGPRLAGTVVVRFTVAASGDVISREITASSGSRTLDDAAVASIDRAAPFPPMPSDVASGPLVVSVPFKFTVR